MAKKCEIYGRGKISGNTISFSRRRGDRTWSPDICRARAIVDGDPERIYVCTRCLRSRKVKRVL